MSTVDLFGQPVVQPPTFTEWLADLDRLAVAEFGYSAAPSASPGPECWRSYFDEGYSPREALMEEGTYQ